MNKIVILYHRNCSDGFGAAWAAWKKFGDHADYIPMEHRDPPPDVSAAEIYLVDFSLSLEPLQELINQNKKVVMIDHHPSSREAAELLDESIHNEDCSGAVLTWRYFHPDEPVPRLLEYIEDIDLWRFKLPKTREILAVLNLVEFDFEKWDTIAKDLENKETRKTYFHIGSVLTRREDLMLQQLERKAYDVDFEGYRIKAVNSPVLLSEIGNLLVSSYPPISIIWHRDPKGVKVSLRGNGDVDVSKIAEKYGGGGLKNAAAFLVGEGEVPWKRV